MRRRPRETETAPALLTNSNGEYRDGSSNKTPHIVAHVRRPPLVAHALQLLSASFWREIKEGGRPREHRYCTARTQPIQAITLLVAVCPGGPGKENLPVSPPNITAKHHRPNFAAKHEAAVLRSSLKNNLNSARSGRQEPARPTLFFPLDEEVSQVFQSGCGSTVFVQFRACLINQAVGLAERFLDAK